MNLPLTDLSPMPFGQYMGWKLADVPASELMRIILERESLGKHTKHEDVINYISDNFEDIRAEYNGKLKDTDGPKPF